MLFETKIKKDWYENVGRIIKKKLCYYKKLVFDLIEGFIKKNELESFIVFNS